MPRTSNFRVVRPGRGARVTLPGGRGREGLALLPSPPGQPRSDWLQPLRVRLTRGPPAGSRGKVTHPPANLAEPLGGLPQQRPENSTQVGRRYSVGCRSDSGAVTRSSEPFLFAIGRAQPADPSARRAVVFEPGQCGQPVPAGCRGGERLQDG
ncbi:collagen alpha-1(I) chain-like isoform X2 [Sorex araneus]|uniref:collagen alpha-1(I) chain-like isoform X2 n=1 Tax=Sorex araneus TaxID=42254 RepID=UPI002433AD8E|nr:collagen alpha-1(I) chain-like isoform X2 [Sorex araneus]